MKKINPDLQAPVSRACVAKALLDALWLDDYFVLEDVSLKALFPEGWAEGESAAAEYCFEFDVPISEVRRSALCRRPEFRAEVRSIEQGLADIVPHERENDPSSWIVYIPFDTCPYNLGGSLYEKRLGIPCGAAAEVADAPYFADCFELVREMVEDGVVLAARTVSEGGLDAALRAFGGARIDLSGVLKAYPGTDAEHLLHSEVPGALIQVSDSDFDYIDAEFLLQDIAYYPLGHPSARLEISEFAGLRDILGSLIRK